MSKHGENYDVLGKVLSRLFVLRESCMGILHMDQSDPNLIWFKGAADILQDSMDGLQSALQAIEGGNVSKDASAEEPAAEDTLPDEEEATAA
jgi:hypothetical protein